MYFFVHRDNKWLAERLESGLKKLIESGEFDRLFYQLKATPELMAILNLPQRTTFTLTNPTTSQQTKLLLNNDRLWLH